MTRGPSTFEYPSSDNEKSKKSQTLRTAKIHNYRPMEDEVQRNPDHKWNFLDVVPTPRFRPRDGRNYRVKPVPRSWTRRVKYEDVHNEEDSKDEVPANEHENDDNGDQSNPPVKRVTARKRTVITADHDKEVEGESEIHTQMPATGGQKSISTSVKFQSADEAKLLKAAPKTQKKLVDSSKQSGKGGKPPAHTQKGKEAQSVNGKTASQVEKGTQPSTHISGPKARSRAPARESAQSILAANQHGMSPSEVVPSMSRAGQLLQSSDVPSSSSVPVPSSLRRLANLHGSFSERLDPNPAPIPRLPLQQGLPSKRPRHNLIPAQSSAIPQQQPLIAPGSSSESDVPLQTKRRRTQPITPARSSMTPAGSKPNEVIQVEDDFVEGGVQQSTAGVQKLSLHVQNNALSTTVKPERLSSEVVSRTLLRVKADNMPAKGPIRVPLSSCNKVDTLFPVLMTERRIAQSARARISDMTATFTWSDESLGIRKDRLDDWDYFSDTIRKAWETHAHRFFEGCYVDIMIHVDSVEEL